MLDIFNEKPVRFGTIAAHLGHHVSAIHRWAFQGLPRPGDGRRVRLEAVKIGSRWVTTWKALQEFIRETSPERNDTPIPMPRSPNRRRIASERAAKRLEAAGW
jgi:hypothetical protein